MIMFLLIIIALVQLVFLILLYTKLNKLINDSQKNQYNTLLSFERQAKDLRELRSSFNIQITDNFKKLSNSFFESLDKQTNSLKKFQYNIYTQLANNLIKIDQSISKLSYNVDNAKTEIVKSLNAKSLQISSMLNNDMDTLKSQFDSTSNNIVSKIMGVTSIQESSLRSIAKMESRIINDNHQTLVVQTQEMMQKLAKQIQTQNAAIDSLGVQEKLNARNLLSTVASMSSTFSKNIDLLSQVKSELLKGYHQVMSEEMQGMKQTLVSELQSQKMTINSFAEQSKHNSANLANSMSAISSSFSKYLALVGKLDSLVYKVDGIYRNMQQEEAALTRQNGSFQVMFAKYTRIFELTEEMNQTSKEIFDLMRLYLVNSVISDVKQ